MPLTMYDRQGQAVQVPDERVQEALASGNYGLPEDSPVHVMDDAGQVQQVAPHELGAALAGGASLASPEDVRKAELEQRAGGVGGALAAAGAEALDTATLGASDVLGSAIGGEGFKTWRREHQEANPLSTLAGGVGGAILPGLVTGGLGDVAEAGELGELASLGSKALTAPGEAVSRAGGAVESAVHELLGAGGEGSAITRLAKAAASKGAGMATEGALYGVDQQVDEDLLGDHELNAEKLYASGLHGALLGLGAGVGLSAAGELSSAVLGRLTPKLGGMAEEQAVRALEPHANGARELERLPGGARGAGRMMLDDGIVKPGDTLQDIAPRVTKAKNEAGAQVGAVYDAADNAGIQGPKVLDLHTRISGDVLPDLEKLPGINHGAISKVRSFLSDLDRFAGIPADAAPEMRATLLEHTALTFRQAQELKSTLGKSINWKRNPFPGVEDKANEALKDVYGVLSKQIDAAGEKAARDLGGSFAADLKAANQRYQTYAALDRIAQNSSRLAEGRNIAPPSTKAAGLGIATGLLAHGSTGGASLAGGIAAAAANQLWKTRGASTAAVLLDKLGALRGVERAKLAVDREVDRGIAGILREPGRAEPRVRALPDEAHPYRAHSEAAVRANNAKDAHRAVVADAVAPLAAHAPKIAQAFQSTAMRAVTYLAGKAPHVNRPPSITPQLDKPRLSKAEEQSYLLQSHAVHDPVSVLDDMAHGRATRAQVEAFRGAYPKLYAEVVQKLQTKLATRKEPLPYEQKKQLAMLFGAAAGPEFEPAFVARMQQDFAAPGGGGGGPKGPPKGGAPKRALKGSADNIKLGGM